MCILKWLTPALACLILAACGQDRASDGHGHSHDHGGTGHTHGDNHEAESWAVTSWGGVYEVFAEADPLSVGTTSKSHTHVTILDGFRPLTEGEVSAILRSSDRQEHVFVRDVALRPGIFSIEITPEKTGDFDLLFRISSAHGIEEIPSGRVRVGDADHPGYLTGRPPVNHGGLGVGAAPVTFLKEQQWKTDLATGWAEWGTIRRTVRGTARIRAASGGEAIVAAPASGVVDAGLRLHTGLAVEDGQQLLTLQPRAGSEHSIADIRSELALARSRLCRLEELLTVGAVSVSEVEAHRSRVAALEPLVDPGTSATGIGVRAPLRGQIAEVWAAAGKSVTAGDPLVRIVRVPPLWFETALDPVAAAMIEDGVHGASVRLPGAAEAIELAHDAVRLIALSPALDPSTGTVSTLLETTVETPGLRIGLVTDIEISTARIDSGVVVPVSAIVDDGGSAVLYIQTDGESFERVDVQVVAREGNRALVRGLQSGRRIVTRGGAAIRRASLLSSGNIEGHVH